MPDPRPSWTPGRSKRAFGIRAALDNPSRRPSQPNPGAVIAEIHAFREIERRGVAQSDHLTVAADEPGREFSGRQRKQIMPLAYEGPAGELMGLAGMGDLRPLHQQRVTTKHPHDQPMHHQLRGVAYHALVQSIAHRLNRSRCPRPAVCFDLFRSINNRTKTKRAPIPTPRVWLAPISAPAPRS